VSAATCNFYLQEIGKTALLTIEEEVQLARRIRRGGQGRARPHDSGESPIGRKNRDGLQGFRLPLLDLISEGNIGLIKAVERFDPRKGGKLSTMPRGGSSSPSSAPWPTNPRRSVCPSTSSTRSRRWRRTAMQLTEQLGREPTDEELAAELQIPTSKVAHLKSVSVRPPPSMPPSARTETRRHSAKSSVDETRSVPFEGLREKNLNS
jgi:RNA polymerase primary sigma factor